ncbi:hypothetical protein GP486_001025 [Trichoglossum hirsutum]|uniref:DNA replication regulator Sld3 C-terminal domain-containing protein n=1 Tax=Trichoglossum hirsutum TaxID=265104 RepID=A0A9P8RT03_9PEZI|nr:hypothetical protein GP486_001025 [Trichoglossum hirsutum]
MSEQPHLGSMPNTPQILKPILILPRSHLPLSYLDTVASSTTIPTARLFSAHIKALESEISNDSVGKDPAVLIARIEADQSLYAIESVSKGVYALCKLGSSVKEKVLLEAASCSRDELQPNTTEQGFATSDSAWWRFAQVPPVFKSQSRRASAAGPSSVVLSMRCQKQRVHPETPYSQGNSGDPYTSNPIMQPSESMEGTATTEQSAQRVFDMIRTQYLETLYISKASLAYFPKGPLSRARTVFNTDYNASMPQSYLITFLRSLVLSLSLVDKKYKMSVPEFIRSLRTSNFSEDDADLFVAKAVKKRRGKKMKPGKDGLYPGEDDFLREWWMNGDSEPSMDTSEETKPNTEQIKRRVANLRIRETELQMILMLEILALQESAHSREQREDGMKFTTGALKKEEKGGKAKRNSKKDSSLALMLELLVDRLCIWQSIGSEDGTTVELDMDDLSNSKAPDRKNKDTRAIGAKALEAKANNDHLRDFYKEVIIPFYATRLPEHCNAITRKLGGSSGSSSAWPPLGSRKVSSRPRDAIKRIAPPRSRQTLERVLTDEKKARSISRGPSMPPTSTRSATAPTVPGLKHEAVECSPYTVPTKDSQPPMNVCRGGVLKSKRFSQREIDMSFTTIAANAASAKLQRKARLEEQLKEAITTLKKPNRGMAVKEFVETAERRALTGPNSKRVKKPVKNALNVQVMATPKGNRKRNAISMTPPIYQNRSQLLEEHKLNLVPKEEHVPQSITRPFRTLQPPREQLATSQSTEQPLRQTLLPGVQDTPSRVRIREGSRIFSKNIELTVRPTVDFLPPPSFGYQKSDVSHLDFKDLGPRQSQSVKPIADVTTEGQRTPLMGAAGGSAWAAAEAGVQETPLKGVESNVRTMMDVGVQETPIKETNKTGVSLAPLKDGGASIYEALGWDEVDDLV